MSEPKIEIPDASIASIVNILWTNFFVCVVDCHRNTRHSLEVKYGHSDKSGLEAGIKTVTKRLGI